MQHVTTETTIDPKEIGKRLREAREAAGMSRAQLAKRTGIPHKAIEKFEYGTQEPSVSRLATLCRALDLSFEQMVGLEKNDNGEDSSPPPSPPEDAPVDIDVVEQVREVLDELDGLREGGFEGTVRRPFALADEGSRLLSGVEPDELIALAHDRALFQSDLPGAGELSDAFEDSFTGAEVRTVEIVDRVIDTGFFGLDLYQIEIEALHGLAGRFEDDDAHDIEASGFFGGWGPHSVVVPKLRPILRRLAVIGQSPNLSNAEEFPQRERP